MDANDRMPGDKEAAAAVAGMAETYGWRPSEGAAVRCPQAFGGGYQDGVVYGPAVDGCWLVDTPEGRLVLFTHELEPRVVA